MGRRATCFDNAVSESFFATYKKELIHTRPWNNLTEGRQHTFLWIEGYYNQCQGDEWFRPLSGLLVGGHVE